MFSRFRRATRNDLGVTSAEYVSIIAFVVAVAVFLIAAAPGIGAIIGDRVTAIIGGAGGGSGDVAGPGSPGSPSSPGAPSPGSPSSGSRGAAGTPTEPGSPESGRSIFDLAFSPFTNPFWSLAAGTYGLSMAPGNLKRARDLGWGWSLYQRTVAPLAARYGPTDPRVTNAYYRWQQLVGNRWSRLNPSASPADELTFMRNSLKSVGYRGSPPSATGARLGLGSRALGVVGKALGPIGIVTGVYGAMNPAHEGWRGVGDRAAGVAGATAGGIATAAMVLGAAGVVFPPGLLVAGAVLGIGAAAWGIGNLISDHGDEVANWVGDRATDAWNLAGEGWRAIEDGAGGLVESGKGVVGDLAEGIGSLF
jgi:hypothetical protein